MKIITKHEERQGDNLCMHSYVQKCTVIYDLEGRQVLNILVCRHVEEVEKRCISMRIFFLLVWSCFFAVLRMQNS